MGIINEIKHVYEALNKLNRYELNSIIAERIATYSYTVLNEDELRAIKKEFGSVESFSNVLAESFTRNDGSLDDFTISDNELNEGKAGLINGAWRLLRGGGERIVRRLTGKPVGNVLKRFGTHELDDIAKFSGKTARTVGHTDIAKYVTRNLTKNANENVVRNLEKQACWLSKNTNMNAKQMEAFMQKYAKCPGDCDPKLWKQAFEEEAKLFSGGTKLENGLVRARYNAIARTVGKTGRAVESSAGKTTITRRMFYGIKRLGKRTGRKIIWTFVKLGGIIYLLYRGTKYLWNNMRGWVSRHIGIGTTGTSGSIGNGMDEVYPKIYGNDYLGENPEDYRII